MKTFETQLGELYEKACIRIHKKIKKSPIISNHIGHEQVIIVDDDRAFNLEGGRWLEEVSETELIDNYGYTYNYSVLDYDDLMNLADYINENY